MLRIAQFANGSVAALVMIFGGSRNVEQNGSNRTAIGPSTVNDRKQHNALCRFQARGKGQQNRRKCQHTNPGDCPKQHAAHDAKDEDAYREGITKKSCGTR
jgi:hypothetical protein